MNKHINQLAIGIKERKSEKDFKELYDTCKSFIIKDCLVFDNIEFTVVEDIYQEVMIDIWRNIDKYDVIGFSILTLIKLKMSQNISRYLKKNKVDNLDIEENKELTDIIKNIDVDKYVDTEEEYIKKENEKKFWDFVEVKLKNTNFEIVKEFYLNKVKTKLIAKQQKLSQQSVLNRLLQSMNKLKEHKETLYNLTQIK